MTTAGAREGHSRLLFAFTIDVDWFPGSHTGLLRLFEFCERQALATSLFVTGRFAETYPDLIREGARRGYEIGTHGWEHGLDPVEDFRSGSREEQYRWLTLSTEAVDKASGVTPVAFRAPNLSLGETTLGLLESLNYRFDSSVPARRFDLGYGQVSSPRYFWAPLRPYHPAPDNLAAEGSSPILEIPPSAFVLPMNMSALRVLGLPALAWAARRIARRSPILVFYAHPVEFELAENQQLPAGQPRRYQQGLGAHNLVILERFVEYVRHLGYASVTLSAAGNGARGTA